MTVVAFDGRVVAGDTLVTMGMLELPGVVRKFHAFSKGSKTVVLGFGGAERAMIPMVLWWLSGGKLPYPLANSDEGHLLVAKLGECYGHVGHFESPIFRPIPYAIGSGQDVAYVLMKEYKEPALQAVRIASKYTQGCGAPFEAFDLKTGTWIERSAESPNFTELRNAAKHYKWSLIE